ncbi:MAG TPA: hypothetical protein VGG75_20910 [Trebonia sp.]|jgi:hypothetical protein
MREAGDGSPEKAAGWKPGGYVQALAMVTGGLDFLNASADQIPETDLGGVLLELEASRSRMTAARAAVLNRFDAAGAHDSDGYQNSSSWLKDKAGMTRPAATGSDGAAVLGLPFPPAVWDDLLYKLGTLAIRFVSGPGAIASVLRTGLLPSPFNTKSVPIEIGYSDSIPTAIRRGVIARAGGRCEWPGGCDRPAAASDVHHITHTRPAARRPDRHRPDRTQAPRQPHNQGHQPRTGCTGQARVNFAWT